MARVKLDALSDTELLKLSREGDSAAFGVLWERHRLAGVVAARNIAATLDPDDLVSGAYLKILELLRDGRGPTGAFRPYLYKVISSLAADTYRSPEHSNSELTEVPDLTEAGPWEDGAFDLNAAAQAFESLPERWQAALWYSEVEGLAPRQIAPILGMSANGVSALSARAKEGLQSAWVERHMNMQLEDEACGTTRSRLQRFQLGKLTSRRSREVAAHLEACGPCAAAAAECRRLNKQLALVLVMILFGGAPAAALLRSLSGVAPSAGAVAVTGTGTTGAASNSTVGSQTSTSVSSTAGTSSGTAAASAGAGAGISVGVIGFVTTAALAVAAVGGVLITNAIGNQSAELSPSEIMVDDNETKSPPADRDEDPDTHTDDPTSEVTGSQGSKTSTTSVRASVSSLGTVEKPSFSLRPTPPTPPAVVPPTAPVEIVAGYQCYSPHIDTGQFELQGRASLPATVALVLRSSADTATVTVHVAADGTWNSGPIIGPLSNLNDFVNGTITAEVRLIAGSGSSLWETVTVTQCAGTGLAVDASLHVSAVCAIDGITNIVYGQLSEYGVIFARKVAAGSFTAISNPGFDGTTDPTDSSVIWSGILTRAEVSAPHFWWTHLALAPYIGTTADYNAGSSGRLEFRVQTPDGRTSTWMPVDQLIEWNSCPF